MIIINMRKREGTRFGRTVVNVEYQKANGRYKRVAQFDTRTLTLVEAHGQADDYMDNINGQTFHADRVGTIVLV